MPVDYSTLVPGQEVSSQTYVLDAATVSGYVDAVGDRCQVYARHDNTPLAPLMAVAALSLRGVVNDLAVPGGTLHVGQELEFSRAVPVGETLTCRATLLQNTVRGAWQFLVVQLRAYDRQGRKVMEGKSTILVPVQIVLSSDPAASR